MNTVTSFDSVTEHARTREALGVVVPRLARLLGAVRASDARSGVPVWTVGDVGAHVATVYLAYTAAATGAPVGWEGLLPPAGESLGGRIAALNTRVIGLVDETERARLGELIAERGEAFLRATESLPPDLLVDTPWYGEGVQVTVATLTGLLLSESLVHGLDIARGAGLRWPIEAEHAGLVFAQVMPTMMPLAVHAERARGARIAFDLAIKGGPRLAVSVLDGAVTVTRDAAPGASDVRISADPVTFLLVAFRRTPLWQAALLGRMRAGGRRPWLAGQLLRLIVAP
ncbi:maleylpyruvate isomerase N-terminal domain-containing protein [Kitasatospora sp. NPDC049285]|uniref:maleylpyruvate isomerase N-terminal domain-containing protein n=1 Tax=Kitasatospora sp. NPDC049285 TaxID=3157096 RepID=UPI003440B4C2